MWLKEIILDGFKSYANRTVISGFDRSFNAITGLNGSGKSNILDSICFVLGISNLSQVRASNLQDLVYKQGQSRVSKATVTLVFDNSDQAQSPVGFEGCQELTVTRQLVIGGRNKYLINGHSAQLSRVQNLFHSVQLNVNNPHFLIMQGRITKVVNMKPEELLALIEEAAGTRMFETKKGAALKTIAKKQSKVEEINKILQEEIQPTLDKLRGERAVFNEWSNKKSEVERLQRLAIAAQFVEAERHRASLDSEAASFHSEQRELQAAQERIQIEIEEIEEKLRSSKESSQGTAQQNEALDKAASDLSRELVKLSAQWANKRAAVQEEEKQKAKLAKQVNDAIKALESAQKEQNKAAAKSAEFEAEYRAASEALESLRSQQLGVNTSGGASDQRGGLNGELMAVQSELAQLQSAIKAKQMRAQRLATEVRDTEKQLAGAQKEFQSVEANREEKRKEVEKIEKKLSNIKFDEKTHEQNEQSLEAAKKKRAAAGEEHAALNAKLSRFSELPKSANSAAIRGILASLFTLVDSKYTRAIEVTAGGKLFNVVVENEKVGKELLENRDLKRRITVIPLNKIAGKSVPAGAVERAHQLVGRENAAPAIQHVQFNRELEAAMKFVFGSTLICSDSASAATVAFDREVKTRCVTMDGDVHDPAGTVEGGSAPQAPSLLKAFQTLQQLEAQLSALDQEIQSLEKEVKRSSDSEREFRSLSEELELAKHQLTIIEKREKSTTFAQLSERIGHLKEEKSVLEGELSQLAAREQALNARSRALSDSIANFEKERNNQMKLIEAEFKRTQAKLNELKKHKKENDENAEKRNMEIASLAKEAEAAKEAEQKATEAMERAQSEAAEFERLVAAKKSDFDGAQSRLAAEKAKLAESNKRIQQLAKEREQLKQRAADIVIELKKLQQRHGRIESEQNAAKLLVKSLLSKHEWIASERGAFGRAGSDFDFQGRSHAQLQQRVNEIQSELEEIAKKINKKVLGMFEKAELEYGELVKKRQIIEADKVKIEGVIQELDKKKNETLIATWEKVTNDFGAIMNSLLPGVKAKLEAKFDGETLSGLEMKVAFNGQWKNSLTELSGGQRSLLALSLILALLLFKPAPMYILDEIDAALDLNHTQNIGQMLKIHFPQSQFIVVSLKEGMFNNANVLFRTKFIDGVSTVQRTTAGNNDKTANEKANQLEDQENRMENANRNGKRKAIAN